jgi:hypothetical protein
VIPICRHYAVEATQNWILKDLNKITDLLKSSPLMSRFFYHIKKPGGLLLGAGHLLGILR